VRRTLSEVLSGVGLEVSLSDGDREQLYQELLYSIVLVGAIVRVITRIVIFATAITIILPRFKIDTSFISSLSALSGAATGFAATQTVGNFLVELYNMISRPFTVLGPHTLSETGPNKPVLSLQRHNFSRVPYYNLKEKVFSSFVSAEVESV